MGFNLAFKGLMLPDTILFWNCTYSRESLWLLCVLLLHH